MAVERPTYMLSPNWDIPPSPDGPLTLGAIMADAKNPLHELNRGSRTAIPDSDLITTHKRDWSFNHSQARSGSIGLWTSMLAPVAGVSADSSVDAGGNRLRNFSCGVLETRYFQPSATYIVQSLKAPFVAAFLAKHGYWQPKPLYMVTGVKIARDAKVESGRGEHKAWSFKVGVDGSATGAPISLGPQAEYKSENEVKQKFTAGDDFVLAYRLIRIRQKSKTGDDFREEDFNKWALMDDNEIKDETKLKEELDQDWDIEDLGHGMTDTTFDWPPAGRVIYEDDDFELVSILNNVGTQ